MLIGELAERSGASRRSLRHYEDRGFIQSQRRANGYRYYEPETVLVVQRIRALLHLDLPLAAVEVLLPCALDGEPAFEPCAELRAMLLSRLERIDADTEHLANVRTIVSAALDRVDKGSALGV